jgi:hypothetical protein
LRFLRKTKSRMTSATFGIDRPSPLQGLISAFEGKPRACAGTQPRSGDRVQPRAQALGKGEIRKPALKGRKKHGANLRQCGRHKPSPAFADARDATRARAHQQGRNLRCHGHPADGRPGHHARAVDEYAIGGWPTFDFPKPTPPQLRLPHLSRFSKGARDPAEGEKILTFD